MNKSLVAELTSGVGDTEGPTRWCDVVGDDVTAVAGGDDEGEALAVEIGIALPVLPPISGHWLPPGPRAFYGHRVNVAGAAHVGHQNQVEVRVTVYREPNPSAPPTSHPTKHKGTLLIINFMSWQLNNLSYFEQINKSNDKFPASKKQL